MQKQRITTRSAAPTAPLSAALAHVAQAKLLLRRAAAEESSSHQVQALHDLAGVLQYVIEAIEQIEGVR